MALHRLAYVGNRTQRGEVCAAFVRVRPGMEATPGEIVEFCQGKIARFKIPRYWRFTDSFPMTITGKIQKFKMRETAVAELGLEKAAAVATA